MSNKTIQVTLSGLRPLMFDRYAGDNNTTLPVAERMYLDDNRNLIVPVVNLYSLLCAENTKSVCRQFFGRQGKTIALGIASYTMIEPFEIPILVNDQSIHFNGTFTDQIVVHNSVARLAKGIPNPKARPMLKCPWELKFLVEYQPNPHCTIENLRQAFSMGGTLGLGTFRPFFGRYDLTRWDIS